MKLMSQLHNIDYFEDDYEPKQCDKCSCGDYVPIQFKLGCSCFLGTDSNCVDFICKSPITTENLAEMCYLILTEKDKIAPMVKELVSLYKIHGIKILDRLMTLTFDPELYRLVLTCETVKNYQKPSVCMARNRKRRELGRDKIITRERDISPVTRWGNILEELSDYISRNGKLP